MLDPVNWLSQIVGALAQPFQWWVVIAPWEAAIRVRLGKTATVLGPGIHLRIPWLDRVFVQSTRMRVFMDQGQTVTSKDGKVITLSLFVQYYMSDIEKMFLTVSEPEQSLLSSVSGKVAEIISKSNSVDLFPSSIEFRLESMVEGLGAEWGLGGIKVMITNFAIVKTFRILSNDYRSFNMGSIEGQKPI